MASLLVLVAAGAHSCPIIQAMSVYSTIVLLYKIQQKLVLAFTLLNKSYGLAVPTSTGHYFALIEEMGAGL